VVISGGGGGDGSGGGGVVVVLLLLLLLLVAVVVSEAYIYLWCRGEDGTKRCTHDVTSFDTPPSPSS
jgi:hypothetical protein